MQYPFPGNVGTRQFGAAEEVEDTDYYGKGDDEKDEPPNLLNPIAGLNRDISSVLPARP